MVERIMGVFRLDSQTFEEVENDQNGTVQALIVVVIAAICSGIGQLGSDEPGAGLVGGIIGGIVGWAVFAAFVTFVGTRLFATAETNADWSQLARVLGFAQAPNFLAVIGFIPVLGPLVAFVGAIWALIAAVIGIRQALEMSTGRAVVVAIVAFILEIIVIAIIAAIFGVAIWGLSD
jgi:hypothetical protein